MDLLQNMLKEINKKLDQVNKKEDLVEKKLENFDKRLGGLLRQVNNKVRIIYPQLKYFRHFFQIVDLWKEKTLSISRDAHEETLLSMPKSNQIINGLINTLEVWISS